MNKINYIFFALMMFSCSKQHNMKKEHAQKMEITAKSSQLKNTASKEIVFKNNYIIDGSINKVEDHFAMVIESSLDSVEKLRIKFGNLTIKNTLNGGLHIKGQYAIHSKTKAIIESVEIDTLRLINNLGPGISIQSIDTKISINHIFIENDYNRVNAGPSIGITTEAGNFENGTEVHIGSIQSKYANRMIAFLQNIKKLKINKIQIDSALYNKKGGNSITGKYGLKLFKIDNALSPKIDLRTGQIDSLIITNSNFKNRGVAALWLDEGVNNITFNYAKIDMPLWITPCNEYCPPSTGNHHFKKLIISGKKPYSMSTIVNSQVDTLIIKNAYVRFANARIKLLKGNYVQKDSLTKIMTKRK